MQDVASKHDKAWRARWHDEHGTRRSKTFQRKRDAERYEARQKEEVEKICAGLLLARPLDRTIGELCDYWIKHRVPEKRSGKHDESIIRAHLRSAFDNLLVQRLRVSDVDRFKAERRHLCAKTMNNLLTLLISMLRLASECREYCVDDD